MRHNGSYIFPEDAVQIINKRLGGRDATAWRMKNEIKAFVFLKSMNGHHERILVFIIDLNTGRIWIAEPARVVGNYGPTG